MPAPDDFLNLKMSTSGQAFYILFGIINLSLAFFYSDGQNPCYIDKFGGEKRYLRTGDLSIFGVQGSANYWHHETFIHSSLKKRKA